MDWSVDLDAATVEAAASAPAITDAAEMVALGDEPLALLRFGRDRFATESPELGLSDARFRECCDCSIGDDLSLLFEEISDNSDTCSGDMFARWCTMTLGSIAN